MKFCRPESFDFLCLWYKGLKKYWSQVSEMQIRIYEYANTQIQLRSEYDIDHIYAMFLASQDAQEESDVVTESLTHG